MQTLSLKVLSRKEATDAKQYKNATCYMTNYSLVLIYNFTSLKFGTCCNIDQIRIYILPFSMFRIKVQVTNISHIQGAQSDNKCQWTIQQTSEMC